MKIRLTNVTESLGRNIIWLILDFTLFYIISKNVYYDVEYYC